MSWYLVQASADLVCGESLMPLLADDLRPAWLDSGHRDTADGDGAGFWDLIEFLCGLATDHWTQLGPADGWAEISRDNRGEGWAEHI